MTVIPAQAGIQNVSYAYDAFGRRIQKNINGEITNYCYDADDIIAEYNNEGELTAKYIYGANTDEILMTIIRAGSEPAPTYYNYYYTYDGLGSVSEITDYNGKVIEKYTYDIYGKVTIRNANNEIIPASAVGNRYYFTSRELDEETGLYYYRARHYDASLGRFLQRDPIGYYDSMNLYAYCKNNAVNYIDPLGLCEGTPDDLPKPPGWTPEWEWVPNEHYDPTKRDQRPGRWEDPEGNKWEPHKQGQDGQNHEDHWDKYPPGKKTKERIPFPSDNGAATAAAAVAAGVAAAAEWYAVNVAPWTPIPDPY